jgi:hypothetical protein
MKRREFLEGLLGVAVAATLPLSWLEGQANLGRICVADPTYFLPKDLIHIPRTTENMLVASVNNKTGWLNVVRGLGSKEAPLKNLDPIWILGSVEKDEGKPAFNPEWTEDEVFPSVSHIVGGVK